MHLQDLNVLQAFTAASKESYPDIPGLPGLFPPRNRVSVQYFRLSCDQPLKQNKR